MGLVAQHIIIKSHSYISRDGIRCGFIHPSALRAFVPHFSCCHPPTTAPPTSTPTPPGRPWYRPPHSIRGDSTDCLSFACQWSWSNSNSILAAMTKPATTLAPTGIFAFFCKKLEVEAGGGRMWAWCPARTL